MSFENLKEIEKRVKGIRKTIEKKKLSSNEIKELWVFLDEWPAMPSEKELEENFGLEPWETVRYTIGVLDVKRISYLLALSDPEAERKFPIRIKKTLEIARPEDCYWSMSQLQVSYDAKARNKYSETAIKREWEIRAALISDLPIIIKKSKKKDLVDFLAELLLNPEDSQMIQNILWGIEEVIEKGLVTPKVISNVINKYRRGGTTEDKIYLWVTISKLYKKFPNKELEEFIKSEAERVSNFQKAAQAVLAGKSLQVGAPPYSISLVVKD
jgi:hypothetical protein